VFQGQKFAAKAVIEDQKIVLSAQKGLLIGANEYLESVHKHRYEIAFFKHLANRLLFKFIERVFIHNTYYLTLVSKLGF
jgi:hypothetical protein